VAVADTAAPSTADGSTADAGRGNAPGELRAAIGFLTRVPVPSRGSGTASTGAAAFGIVGALLGATASIPLVVFGAAHPLLAAAASIGLLAAVSGALHLDGLGDTFDALAAGPGRAEQARTDPRAGAAGVAAIVIVLLVDIAALTELGASGRWTATAAVLVAATISRSAAPAWAIVVGRRFGPVTPGLGTWFATETTPLAVLVAGGTAALVVVLTGVAGGRDGLLTVLAAVAGVAVATIVGGVVIRARGQLDGDGYGFLVEATFAAAILASALAQ
jgi:adenosylcobinamide-GDP ribazoletransferase